MIPPDENTAPAFIHIDVDDLWAVGECYGITTPPEWRQFISQNALPRFRQLFRRHRIRATFFIVGRDLESPQYAQLLTGLLADGHAIANHSHTHRLDFRNLRPEQIRHEIRQCHAAAADHLGYQMQGFRAPGYAWSNRLLQALAHEGYRYDASLMPSPYGGIFRWMDSRLQRRTAQVPTTPKTQYPRLADALRPLYPTQLPAHITTIHPPLIQLTSATSPLLRLPFQAGVCMRLGWPYFRACFEPYRLRPRLPFIFLFHAADLADFSSVPIPFFRNSSFFNTPIQHRYALAQRFLETICHTRPTTTTEDWLTCNPDSTPSL